MSSELFEYRFMELSTVETELFCKLVAHPKRQSFFFAETPEQTKTINISYYY